MKKLKFFYILFLLPTLTAAQNVPQCDSLIINCCDFGTNTLTIQVSNTASAYFFDYPGWILFDSNMDTIAKETVTYFGIGPGFQPHQLQVVAPLNLPLNGFLNLYTLFYDSLDCSFPFTIADTLSTLVPGIKNEGAIRLYPNPTSGMFFIQSDKPFNQTTVTVLNVLGKIISETVYNSSEIPGIRVDGSAGIYFIKMNSPEGQVARLKLIKE